MNPNYVYIILFVAFVGVAVWSLISMSGRSERAAEKIMAKPKIFVVGPSTASMQDYELITHRLRKLGYATAYAYDTASPAHQRHDIEGVIAADAVAVFNSHSFTWNDWQRPRLYIAIANAIGKPVINALSLHPLPASDRRLIVTEDADDGPSLAEIYVCRSVTQRFRIGPADRASAQQHEGSD